MAFEVNDCKTLMALESHGPDVYVGVGLVSIPGAAHTGDRSPHRRCALRIWRRPMKSRPRPRANLIRFMPSSHRIRSPGALGRLHGDRCPGNSDSRADTL